MKILQFPLAKITLGFILGILLAYNCEFIPYFIFLLLGFGIVGLVISYFISLKKNTSKFLFGIFSFIVSVLIGISTSLIHKETYYPNHYIHQINDLEDKHEVNLVLTEKLKSSKKNIRYTASVTQLDGYNSYGKMIVNIPKDSISKEYYIGSHLKIIGTIYKNRETINPNQFDYGRYLENQNIYAQLYANSNQIKVGKREYTLWSILSNFRTSIIHNLEKSNFKNEELNIVIALILGQQQDISPEIVKDYQYAGAVHILSVSGLHVAFILMFITFLLKPIPNSRKGSLLKVVIIVLFLWFFGILAGLSPSVVRSVTMFSFVAVGTHLRRTVNIYHTLLVSMFLILLVQPSFLFDVGFQLSYLALFFILWLQPILSGIWLPKNKIISYFWDIVTVSFAAQIGAMPLSIYYFHQFPGLFFITNLIIIPMLTLILGLGVLVVLIASFSTVPFYLAKPLEWSIYILNSIIHWVASFESCIIKNISFNREMLVSSYLVILFIILWIQKPNFKRLVFAMMSILLLQFAFIKTKYNTTTQKECIVFNMKKSTIISERKGNLVTLYSNDSILENSDNNVTIQSYLVGNFCKIQSKKALNNLISINNKKVFILDSTTIYTSKIKPDILIITQSAKVNLARLLKTWKPKQIVVDGSNFKSYVKLWEATCSKEKIPFHNTNEKGFYKF
jgi:competence protein ComEC